MFAHLGEQAVQNREIYYQGNNANDMLTFGYQERWAEYKYFPSRVSGLFRSNATGTLEAWHLALKFTSLPALDATFVQDAPPVARVVAVTTQPHFILDSYFAIDHARPMPAYSVPGMMDRF